jgi:hypothetical protein
MSFSVEALEQVKTKIERMDKKKHIEILKILKKYADVRLSENKSGVFLNLSYLPKESIEDLQKYIEYVDQQEMSLMSAESQKIEYQKTYFA